MGTELNKEFRLRINMPEDETISFHSLDRLLEKTAAAFPFENLNVLTDNAESVTRDHLINKLLLNKEGGLCYELNPLLYFFLMDNGFDVMLVRGEVYNNESQKWNDLGRTHATILLKHKNNFYLVDTGFGGNLPLKPVPLNGETASSRNGDFRGTAFGSEYGDYILEMKLKHKDKDWKIGYGFDSQHPLTDVTEEMNEIQHIIKEHEVSPFNKTPLITQLTDNGNITLTDTSFTRHTHGTAQKQKINRDDFIKLAQEHFGLQIEKEQV